jgi:ketosteroid isomerase-like protein
MAASGAASNGHACLQALAAGLLALCLAACGRPADEQALRDTIAGMQAAAETRSISGVMDHVTEDFGGSHGLDHAGLRRMLQAQFLGNQKVGVTLGPIEVEMQGERAQVSFSVLLTGGSRYIPERGRAHEVVSGWRVEDGEWRIFFAEWEGEGRR